MANIILTKEQAEKIAGRYGRYSALEPFELPDGLFSLSEKCLSDTDLKDAHESLNEIRKLNGTKNILKLSTVTSVKANEYYIGSEGFLKCIKNSNVTSGIEDNKTVFIKPVRTDIEIIKRKNIFGRIKLFILKIYNKFKKVRLCH